VTSDLIRVNIYLAPSIREHKKFSKDEVKEFERKFSEVKRLEKIDRAIGFIFSRSGFTKEAQDYCKEKGIACSEDRRKDCAKLCQNERLIIINVSSRFQDSKLVKISPACPKRGYLTLYHN
jgi:hypothetical protein